MHLSPPNWVAIMCTVVYYARAPHAFNARNKFQHCSIITTTNIIVSTQVEIRQEFSSGVIAVYTVHQAWGQLLLKVIYYNYNYFVLALLQLQLQLLLKITIPITITITFEM